ncbi:MAG: hypothetical protein JSS64_00970 [Bacteroidetes bacterium]|nr:hypothetical protein [Bacteroidota bacterium]
MKRIYFSTLVLMATTFLFSACKKSDDSSPNNKYKCTTCITKPEALSANDAISKGIYKGVLIGSTGTIKFNVANDNSTITATMVIDGTTVLLTSSVALISGQPYTAPFVGTLNGQTVTINFTVDVNGGNPTISSANIPGHPNAIFTLVKETSNALIECFVGTYSSTLPETGTFNIVLSRQLGKFGGISREDGSTKNSDVRGTIDANGSMKDDKGNKVATLSDDELSGTFQDSNGSTITVNGKRTL